MTSCSSGSLWLIKGSTQIPLILVVLLLPPLCVHLPNYTHAMDGPAIRASEAQGKDNDQQEEEGEKGRGGHENRL